MNKFLKIAIPVLCLSLFVAATSIREVSPVVNADTGTVLRPTNFWRGNSTNLNAIGFVRTNEVLGILAPRDAALTGLSNLVFVLRVDATNIAFVTTSNGMAQLTNFGNTLFGVGSNYTLEVWGSASNATLAAWLSSSNATLATWNYASNSAATLFSVLSNRIDVVQNATLTRQYFKLPSLTDLVTATEPLEIFWHYQSGGDWIGTNYLLWDGLGGSPRRWVGRQNAVIYAAYPYVSNVTDFLMIDPFGNKWKFDGYGSGVQNIKFYRTNSSSTSTTLGFTVGTYSGVPNSISITSGDIFHLGGTSWYGDYTNSTGSATPNTLTVFRSVPSAANGFRVNTVAYNSFTTKWELTIQNCPREINNPLTCDLWPLTTGDPSFYGTYNTFLYAAAQFVVASNPTTNWQATGAGLFDGRKGRFDNLSVDTNGEVKGMLFAGELSAACYELPLTTGLGLSVADFTTDAGAVSMPYVGTNTSAIYRVPTNMIRGSNLALVTTYICTNRANGWFPWSVSFFEVARSATAVKVYAQGVQQSSNGVAPGTNVVTLTNVFNMMGAKTNELFISLRGLPGTNFGAWILQSKLYSTNAP